MKWISVKDALPKAFNPVFTFSPTMINEKHKGFEIATYHPEYIDGTRYSMNAYWEASNCCDYGEVIPTHWMELDDLVAPEKD